MKLVAAGRLQPGNAAVAGLKGKGGDDAVRNLAMLAPAMLDDATRVAQAQTFARLVSRAMPRADVDGHWLGRVPK